MPAIHCEINIPETESLMFKKALRHLFNSTFVLPLLLIPKKPGGRRKKNYTGSLQGNQTGLRSPSTCR